jgi:ElaB/YqjD/DUF883 family membrane-anchored ribosome-binding protein
MQGSQHLSPPDGTASSRREAAYSGDHLDGGGVVWQRTVSVIAPHQTGPLSKEKTMTDPYETQKMKLIHDLKTAVSDVQALMHAPSADDKGSIAALKQSVSDQLGKAMDRLHRLETHASDKLTHTAQSTQTYVQNHPLQAVGLSAALGLLVGLLARRR